MNKKLITVLGLVLALLLWLFLNPQSDTQHAHVPAHSTDAQVEVKVKEQIKQLQAKAEQQALTQADQIQSEAIDFDGLSFMALYRMYRQAILCQKYFQAWRQAKYQKVVLDYPEQFWQKDKEQMLKYGYTESEITQDVSQEATATAYANQCESLRVKWNATVEGGVNINDPETSLLHHLLEKKTKSNKEVLLKKLLKIQKQIPDLSKKVADSIQGKDSWTEEQIDEAKLKIKQLLASLAITGGLDEAAVMAHNKPIYAQIAEINQQLSEQKYRDMAITQSAINELEALLMSVTKHLYSQDAEVYLLALFITELNPRFSVMTGLSAYNLKEYFFFGEAGNAYQFAYQTPHAEFMQVTNLAVGIKYDYFITMGAVNELYYCSLGADCGPEGPIMLTRCLGLDGAARNDACGRSVEDYYFNGGLTAGQLYDVDWLLTAMEQFYAP